MKDQSSSEPLEEKPFLTEDILKDEYRKVIEENIPFGFEYYEELFKWIMSKYKEAYQAGGMPERILAKDAAAKANDRISELEKAIRLLLTGLKAENIDQLMLKAMPEDYLTYGKLYSNIAQDKISSLESELKALREERDKSIAIVKSLADWSRRYPRDRVYTMEKISMDNELIELEECAKAYTLNTEKN